MTPAARTAAAIELLDAVAASPRPADGVVAAFFRGRRYIGAKDRADIADTAYAVLRRAARLDWWLDRAGGRSGQARARVLALLLLDRGAGASAVERLFSGGQYAPAALDEAERRVAAALDGHTLAHPAVPDAVRWECPAWAEAPLRAAFGDRTEPEMAALLEPAPLDLRVNEMKASRDEVLDRLRADGLAAEPTPLSPLGIRVQGRPPLAAHPLFRDGAVEVQDEGSQLAALLVDARPGQQVADFCAGAGGKALAIAARMGGRGRVVACDVVEGRLIRARERIRRAGVDNIEPKRLDSHRDKWIKRARAKFDRVLVDAPCTGTGTWRRNPDARWRPVDLGAITKLQGEILASAARLVKPGGRLVYATCSLLPDENEAVVDAFLAGADGFRPVPPAQAWPDTLDGGPSAAGAAPGPYLRLTPARHGTDGFFVAILARDPAPDPEAPP